MDAPSRHLGWDMEPMASLTMALLCPQGCLLGGAADEIPPGN